MPKVTYRLLDLKAHLRSRDVVRADSFSGGSISRSERTSAGGHVENHVLLTDDRPEEETLRQALPKQTWAA